MATYNVHVTQSSLFFPDTISGSQSTTFAIGNNGLAQSYFVLETVPLYTTSTPKNTSGSFTLGSGLSGLIQNDYFTSVVVNPGGGNLTFVPAIPVTGSTLMMKGMGSRNDDLQANAIASSFAAAVNGAGGLLTGSEYNALLGLTSDLISYNLLGKMKAIYPVVSSQRNLASYTEASMVGYAVQGVSLTSTTQTSPVNSSTAVRVSYVTGVNPFCYQSHTLPANTQYVFSVYLRAVSGTPSVQLNINHSNGSGDAASRIVTLSTTWQRYELPFNTAALSNNFYTVIKQIFADIEFWGWQLELGSTATAYQPTLGLADDVFKNSFKFNLVNPAQFSGSFTSGWTFSPTGMTGNGSSTYMNTALIPSVSIASLNSTHLSYYANTNVKTQAFQIGVRGGPSESDLFIGARWDSTQSFTAVNNGTEPTFAPETSNVNGFLTVSRINSTIFKYYKRGSITSTNLKLSTSLPNTYPIWIGALNLSGTILYPDIAQCAFASIGDGLTDTDAFLFYLAVQRYQTLLNRQV
jgi:hypothetical protein